MPEFLLLLVVVVKVGSVEKVDSSGKVSLLEKVVLLILAVKVGMSRRFLGSGHQGGFSVVPSRWVLLR